MTAPDTQITFTDNAGTSVTLDFFESAASTDERRVFTAYRSDDARDIVTLEVFSSVTKTGTEKTFLSIKDGKYPDFFTTVSLNRMVPAVGAETSLLSRKDLISAITAFITGNLDELVRGDLVP
jgi:hypothetical protein